VYQLLQEILLMLTQLARDEGVQPDRAAGRVGLGAT